MCFEILMFCFTPKKPNNAYMPPIVSVYGQCVKELVFNDHDDEYKQAFMMSQHCLVSFFR